MGEQGEGDTFPPQHGCQCDAHVVYAEAEEASR